MEAERLAEEQRKSEEAARLQEEWIAEREQDAIQSYSGLIFQKLESYKLYPKVAEQSGLSGRVVLCFTVRRNGEVIDPQITEIIGHSSFGDAALQVLRQVGQLPSFPDEIRRCELRVEMPINYRIENRIQSEDDRSGELAEERRKENEEEEKRLREGRKHNQAEELMQHRKPGLMAMIVMQHERAQQETDPDVKSYLMREVQDLQKSLGNTEALAEELIGELAEIVRTAFLVKSCPRCHENKMALIEVSPNAKSIEYACIHCGRRQRAAATSPDAARAKTLEKFIVAVLGKTWFKTLRHGYRCTFLTPEATLPYERPTRELIPEAMRAQVWRRDDGRCVQCGSRENLHIDHIVPVSKGGATSVPNLQVLCQSCNLSKGAKI